MSVTIRTSCDIEAEQFISRLSKLIADEFAVSSHRTLKVDGKVIVDDVVYNLRVNMTRTRA